MMHRVPQDDVARRGETRDGPGGRPGGGPSGHRVPDAGQAGDAQLLLALARDQSTAGRRSLAFSMADLFGAGGGVSERSRELAAQILDRLIRSFESELRHALAERLARRPDVPRALILLLANDAIEVARPVLLESEVLRPEDLIDIIRRRGVEHQLAIAMRHSLSEAVCLELVATDNIAVIETLLKNGTASIPQRTLDYLVEEAHWVEAYREPLVQRKELRPPLARRLYALVSAALRQHILEHFDIDPEALDDELEPLVEARTGRMGTPAAPSSAAAGDRPAAGVEWQTFGSRRSEFAADSSGNRAAQTGTTQPGTAQTGTASASTAPASEQTVGRRTKAAPAARPEVAGAADRVVMPLDSISKAAPPAHDAPPAETEDESAPEWQEITPEILIALLRRGDRANFERCFAQLSGLGSPRLEQVLYGTDGKELAVACRGLGIDKKSFAVIVFLCRQGGCQNHPGKEVDDPRVVAQVIDYFDQMEPAAALARLRRWRRNPDYAAAVEELEARAGKGEDSRDDL